MEIRVWLNFLYPATDPTIDSESSPGKSFQGVSMTLRTVTHSPQAKDATPLILVAEDDEDTRLILKYLLEIWKYRVVEAADGAEAIQITADCQPDLVLLNVKLQGTDDLTNSRRRRVSPAFARSEIILISDRADETVRAAALAEGIGDFLTKPIDFGELEKMLQDRLQRRLRLIKTPVTEAV